MKLLVILFVLLASVNVSATEATREVSITEMLSLAADRPNAPASQNLTRVYVNLGPWGGTQCRDDAADLLKVDNHTYSLLLAAWLAKKTVKISVDDRLKPYDTVCQIVSVRVK